MGMELRISEIRNEKAKLAARIIDDGDGVLKENEVSVFQDKAVEMGVKAKAINDVVEYFSHPEELSAREQRVQARQAEKDEKKADKAAEKAEKKAEKAAESSKAQGIILDAIMDQGNKEIEGTTGNTQTASGQDVVTDKDLTKRRHVKKDAKADLKESGAWDDVRKEWRKGRGREFFTGEKSFVNSASRIQSAQNDSEQSVIQTTEEVMKTLETDKKMDLLNSLNGKEVAKRDANGKPIEGETLKVAYKDDDGNWHFDGLSQEIEHIIGADLKLNRDAAKDRLVAEFTKLHGRLNLLTGQELSKEEVRELVRLCGFDIEPKDWRRIVAGALTGGAIGAAAGASGAAQYQTVVVEDQLIDINNYIDVSGIVDVTVDTTITIAGEAIKIAANMGTAAALGAIVPAIIGAINGLKDAGQKPVVPTNFSATSPKELIEELKAQDNPYAEVFGTLAFAFRTQDENGNVTGWDREGFKDFLNKVAGNENILLNKEELLGAAMGIKRGEYTVQEPEAVEEVVTEPVAEEQTIDIVAKEPKVEKPIEFEWKHEHNWHAIVAAYYPELANENLSKMKPAIDAFRKGHGISFSSGTPVGQLTQLKPITINGIVYEPKQCTEEELEKAIEKYGWNCGYFSANYNKPITHTAKLEVKSYNDNGRIVYSGTLQDNKGNITKRVSDCESADSALASLRPDANSNSDINLTINITENGQTTTKTETIKKQEQ